MLRGQLQATIMPVQRTIEILQAEFIPILAKEQDDVMTPDRYTDAKDVRIGSAM